MLGEIDRGGFDSVFELFKLAGRQCDLDGIRRREALSGGPFTGNERFRQFHALLEVTAAGYDEFAERVSCGDHCAFVSHLIPVLQYRLEAALHSEILLNRIMIDVRNISVKTFRKLVDDMVSVFKKNVTSYDAILPGHRPPYELFTLRLNNVPSALGPATKSRQVEPPVMSVLLERSEFDMRFVNSEVAFMAGVAAAAQRELSGRLGRSLREAEVAFLMEHLRMNGAAQ